MNCRCLDGLEEQSKSIQYFVITGQVTDGLVIYEFEMRYMVCHRLDGLENDKDMYSIVHHYNMSNRTPRQTQNNEYRKRQIITLLSTWLQSIRSLTTIYKSDNWWLPSIAKQVINKTSILNTSTKQALLALTNPQLYIQ